MTAAFHDHFSRHAPDYRAYRPNYPPELFAFLKSLVPHATRVWDCGTGSGQAAVALADHFPEVFATDASAEQVTHAEAHPRVTYVVAPAEKCPLPGASVDLVTVAQALHWFDLDRFYAEVRRVCRSGGVLAAWTYDLHSMGPELDPILNRLQHEFVGSYWPPERKLVSAGYRTIPFPFADIPAPQFVMAVRWTLGEVFGYMNTWSATKRFIRTNEFNPVERLTPEFAAAWGDPVERRTVSWAFHLRIGRVS
jgi:SAM-dependent methyltransferase